ncbi:MAG: glycosyltransferase family 39 protein [Chitinophaga sp.]|uniref:ArnT family glycosyltransferase n=1 Tax=Chitinophaga sp. TaxID=1869181 RepID=UPI0025C72500|nr:glycosyltransferase family 39 protein [Chitinophaga sp.]MBV8252113.1 glycosyltransferase family 39 protein [Chitinophaga sp.]
MPMKSSKFLLLFFCLIKLTLHLIADVHSGFQGDELLHISTGNHPAFGYMEFPPLIALLAGVQNLFHSDTVWVHHLLPHIASLIIMITVARITIALGGGNKAVFLTLLAFLIMPATGRSQQLLQPVVFSQLFWVLSFYQLLRYMQTTERKYLLRLFVCVTLGFLTKYDMLFFAVGLVALFTTTPVRKALMEQRWWRYVILFLLILLPNIIWQYLHDWPVYQMFHQLKKTQLDQLSYLHIIIGIILGSNIYNLVLLLPAIVFIFIRKPQRIYLPVGLSILTSFLLLLFNNGKSYYFFPIVFTLIPFGAVCLEETIFSRWRWIFWPVSLLLLYGAWMIPFGMPVLNMDNYIKYYYKYQQKDVPGTTYALQYEEYYTNDMWKETLQSLRQVYDNLPQQERANCMIWGKHYSQTGLLELMGAKYGLPAGFGYHGSFYSWAPEKGPMPQTVIAVAFRDTPIEFFTPFFEKVDVVKVLPNYYAEYEGRVDQTIYICRQPRYDFSQMKENFRLRIFE